MKILIITMLLSFAGFARASESVGLEPGYYENSSPNLCSYWVSQNTVSKELIIENAEDCAWAKGSILKLETSDSQNFYADLVSYTWTTADITSCRRPLHKRPPACDASLYDDKGILRISAGDRVTYRKHIVVLNDSSFFLAPNRTEVTRDEVLVFSADAPTKTGIYFLKTRK